MSLSSIPFVFIFLPIFVLLYYLFPRRGYRAVILFIGSLFFFAWLDPNHLPVMGFSILLNFSAGLLILAAVAFVVTVVFVEQAIAVVTAVVGGLLVGLGLIWLDVTDMTVVVVAMLATMVFGAALQLTVIKDKKEIRTGAVAAVPVAPAMPGRMCPKCGGPLTYVPEYNRYYCHRCQQYE